MSLNYDTIKHMNLFIPNALVNEYIEQYAYEYGQKKVIKIIRKVEDSVKVKHYLNSIVHDTLKPSAKGLETLMNTINYFLFSKEETLCLGGLATFVLWRDRFMSEERVFDVLEQEKNDQLLTPICSELIYNCSVNKINQSNNFFLRFEKRIIRIVREEGVNDIWNSNKEIKSGSVSVTKTKDEGQKKKDAVSYVNGTFSSNDTTVFVVDQVVTFESIMIISSPFGPPIQKDAFTVYLNGIVAKIDTIESIECKINMKNSNTNVIITFNSNLNFSLNSVDEFMITGPLSISF